MNRMKLNHVFHIKKMPQWLFVQSWWYLCFALVFWTDYFKFRVKWVRHIVSIPVVNVGLVGWGAWIGCWTIADPTQNHMKQKTIFTFIIWPNIHGSRLWRKISMQRKATYSGGRTYLPHTDRFFLVFKLIPAKCITSHILNQHFS